MAIEWTSELSTDVTAIDDQHKELFRMVNALFEACNQGKGAIEMTKAMKFLEDYVGVHFSAEEDYMKKYFYPKYSAHKSEHLAFIEKFTDLKTKFEKEGAGIVTVILLNRIIVDWLTNHIRKVDKEMGAFLKSRISKGTEGNRG
jgi:hemerythrin